MRDILTDPGKVPSLSRSLLIGGLGFSLVSLCVFFTVAFGESWMYKHLGLLGAYLAWTAIFILPGGVILASLVVGRRPLGRFYLLFALAFFGYAAAWMVSYFVIRGTVGEAIGSLAGSFLMGSILTIGLGAGRSALRLSTFLFLANSAGYFLGVMVFYAIGGNVGMLLFGAVFGLGLGIGLALLVHFALSAAPKGR